MKLAGRVPVEPLDEERLTNIERRVVAGAVDAAIRGDALRAPHRLVGRAVVAVAIAAAVVVGWALHGARGGGPTSEPAAVAVRTAAQRSVIDIGDARIESDPETAFVVTRPGGGVLVALSRGKVALAVDKRGERPPLVVRAGDTDVVVVGTRFTVDYGDGRGDVDVQVAEGAVRVMHGAQATRVAAGHAWQTRSGLVAAAEPAERTQPGAPHPTAVAATDPGGAPATATGDDTAGTGDRSAAGDRAAVARSAGNDRNAAGDRCGADPRGAAAGRSADGDCRGAGDPGAATDRSLIASSGAANARSPAAAPAVFHDRKAAVPDAPRAPGAEPRSSGAPAQPRGGAAPPSRVGAPAAEVARGDLRTQIRAQRVEPALDLGDADTAAAIARYYDIAAHHSGDEASQAFYSIAVVQALKAGRAAEALDTLDGYVRRFPGGKEFRAALWLRVRLLCLDQLDDRCRAAAYTYLHAAPESPAAHVAELLTQTR